MDKDRILALAEIIERQPHTDPDAANGFTMSDYVHACGTPACIAGWASFVSKGGREDVVLSISEIADDARSYLGIDDESADELFLPSADFGAWDKITPDRAAQVLRRLAETGEVEWVI